MLPFKALHLHLFINPGSPLAKRGTAARPERAAGTPGKRAGAKAPPSRAVTTHPRVGEAPERRSDVSVAVLLRQLRARAQEKTATIEKAKREFEAAARSLRDVVAASRDKVLPGPRRFRPGPAHAREIQRKMSDLGVEMRILAARRAELQWVQLQLGAKP